MITLLFWDVNIYCNSAYSGFIFQLVLEMSIAMSKANGDCDLLLAEATGLAEKVWCRCSCKSILMKDDLRQCLITPSHFF